MDQRLVNHLLVERFIMSQKKKHSKVTQDTYLAGEIKKKEKLKTFLQEKQT